MVKLFSNFDTSAPTKNYAAAVHEFGFDKVVFLRRHKLYFYLYTVIPAVTAIILMILVITSFFRLDNKTAQQWNILANNALQLITLLVIFYMILLAWARYFNYTLDYTIITPTYISAYDQQGIFNRKIITIEPSKIKTINFSSRGVINSLFNFGNIDILLEWDDKWNWEIIMNFIYDPEWVKRKIQELTETKNEEKNILWKEKI